MVTKLDIPIRQVMIESRIVNADESFTRDLGVQFGYSKHSSQQSQANGDLFAAGGGTAPGFRDFGSHTIHKNSATATATSWPAGLLLAARPFPAPSGQFLPKEGRQRAYPIEGTPRLNIAG